jgi:FkbM family methyltransferase
MSLTEVKEYRNDRGWIDHPKFKIELALTVQVFNLIFMLLKKIRREILVALSMIGLKSAIIKRNGHKYSIPLIHGMGRWLFIKHDPWRRKVLRTIEHSTPIEVLDIGINVGQSLLDFHEILPNARYVGIEPNPACVFYLNELIRRNSLTGKMILPFGLNEKKETLSLMSKGWDDASSSVVAHRGNYYETTIYTLPGDDIVEELKLNNLKIIKIDVEGFELSVIKGLKRTIETQRPLIFCEINKRSTQQSEFFEYVTSLGYHIYMETLDFSAIQVHNLPLKERFGNDFILIHPDQVDDWLKKLNNV